MNKKRLLMIASILLVLIALTGCASSTAAVVQETKYISLDTPFQEMKSEGVFTAFLTYPLAQAINFLSQYVGVAGAVTIVTILLNVIILAFTFKSNVSMQRMQTIQPEMDKIQAKYAGKTDNASQQRMAMETQQLFNKYDIHPLGSLLVTFIQLPVLISMYSAVRRSYAVAHGTFLGQSLELTPMQGFTSASVVIIAIYVLMVVTQYLSIQLPMLLANIKAKKEAELHHKHYEKKKNPNAVMTYSMLVMISVVMLNWPTALSLYYCIYSLVNIAKTLIIDKITNKESK